MKSAKSGTVTATARKRPKTAFGFDAAYPIEQLDKKLAEFLVDRDTLWHAIGHDAEWDTRIAKALNEVRAQTRAGKRAPRAIHDLRFELDRMRLVKDAPKPTSSSARPTSPAPATPAPCAPAAPAWPNTNWKPN
jgi:Xaa-Pro aminopeptidase